MPLPIFAWLQSPSLSEAQCLVPWPCDKASLTPDTCSGCQGPEIRRQQAGCFRGCEGQGPRPFRFRGCCYLRAPASASSFWRISPRAGSNVPLKGRQSRWIRVTALQLGLNSFHLQWPHFWRPCSEVLGLGPQLIFLGTQFTQI